MQSRLVTLSVTHNKTSIAKISDKEHVFNTLKTSYISIIIWYQNIGKGSVQTLRQMANKHIKHTEHR